MGEVKLLDCTLRDGGYLNDWNFGHNNLVSIFERLVDANIDFIEVGFLDDRRKFDINRSIMPDTASVEKIYGELEAKKSLVVGMIDYGTCKLENIQPCKESYLDAIRVIFKKHLREEAMEYCAKLKELGYQVFAQLVSVTSYSDEEMLDLIRLANNVKPYAVSMVDTYGLMHQNNLKHYFGLLDEHLDEKIALGYHAHNNFQMGYANCIEMLAQKTDRTLLVDGTVYGMGKSAGNAPIELLAMHMNSRYGKKYHVSQILEAIDVNIMNFYTPASWGYNMFYYLAASNDCHPNYVSDLIQKRTLSVKSVNEILGRLQGEKKLLYDKSYIEKLYKEYQSIDVNDKQDILLLTELFKNKNILLVGPGLSIEKQKNVISKYIEQNHPVIISVNFISGDFDVDYVFLSNSKRYVQLATPLSKKNLKLKVIATSNVTKTSGKFDYTLKYSDLLDEEAEIIDNSFIMLLKAMIKFGVSEVALAGFDGYQGDSSKNYINANMEYQFSNSQAQDLNEYVSSVLKNLSKKIQLNFITKSLYIDESLRSESCEVKK